MPATRQFVLPAPALLFSTLFSNLFFTLFSTAALAQTHEFKDWAIACDNTRHCEAVGYQTENSESKAVAMHLARDAGPDAPVQIRLTWDEEGNSTSQSASLRIGKLVINSLKPEQSLSESQVQQVLPALLKANNAVLKIAKEEYTLSLAGLHAALLKMDDLQGRIETPGALVRKGRKPEAGALPALPLPTVRIAPLPKANNNDKALLKAIFKSIKDRSCFDDIPDSENPETVLQAISPTQVLVMRECSRGAYQAGSIIWLANIKAPHAPQVVMLPTPSGKATDYVMNAQFEDGQLSSWSKGRGINDCGLSMAWGWSGKRFELISASSAPLCRGLPMGGFMLQLWQAKVLP